MAHRNSMGARAKAETVESLERALADLPSDQRHAVERIDLLTSLATAVREFEQWDRMLALAAEAHELSTAAGYTAGLARSMVIRAFVKYIRSEYAEAIQLALEALELASGDEYTEAWAKSVQALVQWSLGNFDEAMRQGSYATEVFRRQGDHVGEAFAHTSRGGILHSLGRYNEAVEAQLESLEVFRSVGHKVGEARALSGLATSYHAQGYIDKALSCARESLELARASGHTLGISRALNDLGEIHLSRGEPDLALACHEEALAMRHREGYRQAEATSLLNIGRVHQSRGDLDRAIEVLTGGLAIVEQIGALPKVRDYHLALSSVYESLERYADALRHAKAYSEVRAKISTDQATARRQAIELESKLIWAQKDGEIQRLRNVELKRALDELQAMQAELVNSEKLAALGSLVAALAHEINSPLGVINSASDVIMRYAARVNGPTGVNAAELLQTNAQLIAQASARIGTVVQRLKSFAGIDRAAYARTSIRELIDNTIALLEPEYRGRVDVITHHGDIPMLYCFAADLSQVLMNLIRNAIQAIDGAGCVTIRSEADQERVAVSVKDSGRGIAPEHMAHLFDAGFNSRDRRIRASLSLFASASIVRRHGGEIKAESRLGEGSTFTVILPRSLEDSEQPPRSGVTAQAV